MATVIQDQSVAEGSHPVDPSPQASDSLREPILVPINPMHDLAQYRTLCSVDSVYYYPDGEHTRAAVVLEVGFFLPFAERGRLKFALVPTRVPDVRLDRFPEVDESVEMSRYTVTDDRTFSPNIQTAVAGGSFGSMSRQTVQTLYGFLHLLPQRGGRHDEIRWQFVNQKSNYFPSSVKLLLIVKGGGSPCFPFKLEILPTLEVHIQNKWWHKLTTKLQPEVNDGWSCQIENDYNPDTARRFSLEYHKPTVERDALQITVGLHAAMVSYLEAIRR